MSEEEYQAGRFSRIRNPVLATAFLRLGYIEQLGTGVLRIKEAYADSATAPVFETRANSICVTLPLVEERAQKRSEELLDGDEERAVFKAIQSAPSMTRRDIEDATGFGRDKVMRVIRRLLALDLVNRTGRGRTVRYSAYAEKD